MMIGEDHHHVPPWQESHDNPTVLITPSPPSQLTLQSNGPNQLPNSPTYYDAVLASLSRYLNAIQDSDEDNYEFVAKDYDDDFFMYEFKVRKCVRAQAHDWTECPFAHPGEKARRRDPRKYNYSGTSCSEFRKGGCKKGDGCEFAHGVFECWLHPTRFRTQACKDGRDCKRRVCFFAHKPDEFRTMQGVRSPRGRCLLGSEDEGIVAASATAIGELTTVLRTLHVGDSTIYGSPRSVVGSSSINRPGFFSMPTTPTQSRIEYWDDKEFGYYMGDPILERVESGRELRVRMFEKLSKENPLDGSGILLSISDPDLGWVSDLIE